MNLASRQTKFTLADCSIMASAFFLTLFAVITGLVIASNGQFPLAGGLSDIDVNSHAVQDLKKDLPSMTKHLNGLEIVKVVRAQLQVVSGIQYILKLEIRNKGSSGPATQECSVIVWIQQWLKKRTVTSFKCKRLPELNLLGGWHEAVVTDLVKKSANIGLDLINKRCNCMYRKTITEVKRVQEKVVVGLMQKISVELIESTCKNSEDNQGKGLKECPARENEVAEECDITMLYQPWLPHKFSLVEHTCN